MAAARLTPLWLAIRCPSRRNSILAASSSISRSTVSARQTEGRFRGHTPGGKFHSTHTSLLKPQDEEAEEDIWAMPESKAVAPCREQPPEEQTPAKSLQSASIPWYLQDQKQEPEINPFLDRQRIPELPENPPPVLEPMLKHISVDLGLDYVSVLDLRSLDPPPAFGANLLMIIGSARSEKHLNVSADRLCRWLRTNYKLRPNADGLLGRNELKLKLRRKNRRSRIMNAAGGTLVIDPDDGITTGWICVDVGTVDGGLSPVASETGEGTFVGFGTGPKGAKIVVQMLTEEKRGAVDLDGLWQSMLDREARRKEGHRKAIDKTESNEDLDVWVESRVPQSESRDSRLHDTRPHQSQSPFDNGQQVRRLHTSVERPNAETSYSSNGDASYTLPPPPSEWTMITRSDPAHLRYLMDLPPAEAIHALGVGERDHDSTAFLRSYHSTQPMFRPAYIVHAGIRLQCHAIKLGHPGYTRDHLLALLRECQACGFDLPEPLCMQALEACLTAHNVTTRTTHNLSSATAVSRAIIRRCFLYAKEVFEIMEIHGYSVTTTAIFKRLHSSVMDPHFSHPNRSLVPQHIQEPYQTVSDPITLQAAYAALPRQQLAHSVRNAIDLMYVPPPSSCPQGYDSHLFKSMMIAYIRHNAWPCFWALWNQLARRMLPRDPEMYAILFQGMAGGGSMKVIAQHLLENVDEMEREEPPIWLEKEPEVAKTLKYAMLVAGVGPESGEPYARWWRTVERALGEGK